MYLPGFNQGFGRRPKTRQKQFSDKAKELRERLPGELPKLFMELLAPESILIPGGTRKRVFDLWSTFWINLDQILHQGSLRWANRQMQLHMHKQGTSSLSASTGAYCRARKRIPLHWIKSIHQRILGKCVEPSARVLIVDGTSVQLPDTAANQDAYPQSGEQKEGCGMPIVQLVGLFEAHSGMLVDFEESPWSVHENAIFQALMHDRIHAGDLLIADRAYCSFYNFHKIQQAGADLVMRLHQARKPVFEHGKNDIVVSWKRPNKQACPDYIDPNQWEQLPEKITVRYIRYRIEEKGFRTREVILVTTLMNTPTHEVIELYFKRWQIEVSFRDVKTSMGMDLVNVKSPELALKQIWMFVIAHNLIRHLINTATKRCSVTLSFKGTLDTLSTFTRSTMQINSNVWTSRLTPILKLMLEDPVPIRPGRVEPRCVKRRPKGYQLMTSPRHLMVVSESRSLK